MAFEFLYPFVASLGIILITWITTSILNVILKKIFKRVAPMIATHIRRLTWSVVWLIGIVLAIEQLGLRIDLLILIIGLLGITLIVAVKDPIQCLAAKYFSDVYIPYKVGSSIKVGNHSGKVIEINPITTILLTEEDQLISIPNTYFLREIAVNLTPQAWKEIVIPIVIDREIDTAEFESEVLKSCNKLRIHLDERFPPIITLKSKDETSTQLSLTLMVKEVGKKDAIVSEVNSKITEILDKMKHEKAAKH